MTSDHPEFYQGQLVRAANDRNFEKIKFLLEKGVDPDEKDRYGYTAVMWASVYNDVKTLRLLMDYGADINAIDNQDRTALFLAATCNQSDTALLLIEKGAEGDLVSAAHYARHHAHFIMAEFLQTEIDRRESQKAEEEARRASAELEKEVQQSIHLQRNIPASKPLRFKK